MKSILVSIEKKDRSKSRYPISRRQSGGILNGVLFLFLLAFSAAFPSSALAQGPTPPVRETPLAAPDRVDIEPTARDGEIRERLTNILEATGWFLNPEVRVQEGVVFLSGETETEERKTWAGDLARNTQDVVAVVNQIELTEPSIWDIEPAVAGLRDLWVNLLRAIPLIGFSVLVILVTWVISRFTISAARTSLSRRLSTPLLSNVISYSIGVVVFLLGLYVVLQIAGLTGVAMTVLGGTGLLGLVLGIAFRDISENFLASIFLSLQNPFRSGDLVEIVGILGFVQALNTRVTILMTPDGNHVQIPNSTVYKSNIYNYTSNPNRQIDFAIGIGFADSITEAQETALHVLETHPAVLKEPEPWVLVESLGSATVNLRVYFWLDASQHSFLKVKSSVIRLVMRAFQEAGISMPDEAREMVFPEGVPVQLLQPDEVRQAGAAPGRREFPKTPRESESVSTQAEGGLRSEAGEIKEQARQARTPEEGENLLQSSDNDEPLE